MGYNFGPFGEQGFARNPSFDGADAGDSITLSHWVDESLLDPVSESSSGAHIPPSSQWGSFGNHFPLLCGSSDWEQASAMVYSAQPHDYQLGNQVPCSLAFDDGGKTVPLAGPIPFQAPESAFWSFKPPERPLVFPTPSNLHYLQNTGGQYYPNQVSANDTHEYWQELYMVMCLAGVPIQASENAHSIEPHQMHLDNPTLPSEVEIEPTENDTFQSQIAPSSSTTVEQLPLQTPSGGRERRRASKYETPNSIVLETAASQETKDNAILERCRKYRKVSKNKRILCHCSQDPALRLLLNCRGSEGYKGEHEWKRGHKLKRDIACEDCGKTFKRKDTKDIHRNKYCRSKPQGA